jgi:hypothetical protein
VGVREIVGQNNHREGINRIALPQAEGFRQIYKGGTVDAKMSRNRMWGRGVAKYRVTPPELWFVGHPQLTLLLLLTTPCWTQGTHKACPAVPQWLQAVTSTDPLPFTLTCSRLGTSSRLDGIAAADSCCCSCSGAASVSANDTGPVVAVLLLPQSTNQYAFATAAVAACQIYVADAYSPV